MRQILYTSRVVQGTAREHLPDILHCARRNNPELGVTGILLVHDAAFLQLLEGEAERLDFLVDTIADDPRHIDMRILLDRPLVRPLCTNWSMAALCERTRQDVDEGRALVARALDAEEADAAALVEALADLAPRLGRDAAA